MAILRSPARYASSAALTFLACVLVVLLILIPKGGVRLAGIPLTWGYLLLIALTPPALAVRFLAMPLLFPRRVLGTMLLLLPMQGCFLYAGMLYGIESFGFVVGTFAGLFALPWIFILLFGPLFPWINEKTLRRWFCGCVFWAAAWGLLLFVLYPLTHHDIEIPYITVNAADYGTIDSGKSNARGLFLKLVSTYNNGNIYGVATLLLFPLYARLESRRWRRMVVRLALLLTLARTVWVGLILTELLSLVPPLYAQIRTFPVLYLGEARRRFAAVLLTIFLVFGSVSLVTLRAGNLGFLFDRSLGNRTSQYDVASQTTFLPEQSLHGFQEVLYASAAEFWGVVGLFAFTLLMLSPLLVTVCSRGALRSPLRRAALKALLVYAVIAASDGAFNFIPVMAFYWFVYAVFLYDWPGTQPHPAHPRPVPVPPVPLTSAPLPNAPALGFADA